MSKEVQVTLGGVKFIGKGNWSAAVMMDGVELPDQWEVKALDGGKVQNYIVNESLKLREVEDLSGRGKHGSKIHLPPTSHLGKLVDPNDPLLCANLAYDWLDTIILEAKEFEKTL